MSFFPGRRSPPKLLPTKLRHSAACVCYANRSGSLMMLSGSILKRRRYWCPPV